MGFNESRNGSAGSVTRAAMLFVLCAELTHAIHAVFLFRRLRQLLNELSLKTAFLLFLDRLGFVAMYVRYNSLIRKSGFSGPQ